MPGSFLSIDNRTPLNGTQLSERLKATVAADQPRWYCSNRFRNRTIHPKSAARSGEANGRREDRRAEAIFAADVFDPETDCCNAGLAAYAVPAVADDARSAGSGVSRSFVLPEASENHIFARPR
jgi:hypothetical protein